MLTKRVILSTLGIAAFAMSAEAQDLRQQTKGLNGLYKEFGEVNAPAPTTLEPAAFARLLGLPENANVKLLNYDDDALGMRHVRLQQTYMGFPIENSMYLVHSKGGTIIRTNGQLVANFPATLANTQRQSRISPQAAVQAAMARVGATSYKWQLSGEEAFLKAESGDEKATFYPSADLVWFSGTEELDPANLRLAYKLDIYAHEPVSRQYVFVDAQTGKVLAVKERLHTTDVPGSAVTGFSGTQTITTDSYNGSYRLRETGRGLGIQTFNLKKGTSYSTAVDFTDADNVWNNVNTTKDQYAADAHWGAEKTYDYFKNVHGRNSIDGAGFAIKNYVHYSTNYFNAFWDGTRMTYGDGNATNGNKPLTAIDVCGHEITHGLTSFTANLNYTGESGALNEGFSDIFGNTIEAYARPTQNSWLVGEDFYTIRSMSNPNTYQQPDTYQGTYWGATGSTAADNGGVHTNSGVLNYWYYLLCAGGSGTNDIGTAFNVTSIGTTAAAAIAFRTLTVYLTPTSNFAACKTASLQAATDLYGAGSAQVTQVTNAWTAVGVGSTTGGGTACTDTYETNETRTTAKAITTNTAINAKIGTSTDIDWFSFANTSTAKNIKISLASLPADYDVVLYNAAGTQVAISQNASTTAESIIYNNGAIGTYYIKVYGYSGATSANCYSLTASVSGTAFFGIGNETGATDGDIFIIDHANPAKANTTSIYPNPAQRQIYVRQTAEQASEMMFSLYDLSGKLVLTKILSLEAGENQLMVELPVLQNGLYFVRIGEGEIKRIMLMNN